MKQRIITALFLIPLAVGWMFFLPLDYFCLGAIVIFLLASLVAAPHPVILGILYAGALWWVAALVMVLAYPKGTRWWRSKPWLKALFGILTLLPFFWSLLLLRSHGYVADPQLGGWIVFFVMLLVWCYPL